MHDAAVVPAGPPLAGVRRRFGLLLRAKVAGDDAAERARQIWGKPGERWFSRDDPIWRVHKDASMFVGGITTLLLQSLHPLAMAGVAGHSGYRSDPWGRLQRTSDYLAVTTGRRSAEPRHLELDDPCDEVDGQRPIEGELH